MSEMCFNQICKTICGDEYRKRFPYKARTMRQNKLCYHINSGRDIVCCQEITQPVLDKYKVLYPNTEYVSSLINEERGGDCIIVNNTDRYTIRYSQSLTQEPYYNHKVDMVFKMSIGIAAVILDKEKNQEFLVISVHIPRDLRKKENEKWAESVYRPIGQYILSQQLKINYVCGDFNKSKTDTRRFFSQAHMDVVDVFPDVPEYILGSDNKFIPDYGWLVTLQDDAPKYLDTEPTIDVDGPCGIYHDIVRTAYSDYPLQEYEIQGKRRDDSINKSCPSLPYKLVLSSVE